MAFAYVNGWVDDTDVSAFTITGPSSGTLIVCWAKWESGVTLTGITCSTGETVNILTVNNHSNGDLDAVFFYIFSTSAASKTFNFTFSGTPTFKRRRAGEFSYSTTPIVLAENASAETSSGHPVSGTISISGDDLLVVGGCGEYSATNPTTPLINGAAATFITESSSSGNYCKMWYTILTSGFSGGTASATGSNVWVTSIAAFGAPSEDPTIKYFPWAFS